MWSATADHEQFSEAVDWLLKRTVVDAEKRRDIPANARSRAFWIAGVAQLDVVNDVYRELQEAANSGLGYNEFRKNTKERLLNEWGGVEPTHRIRLIYRNATISSLNAGRWEQMRDPVVLRQRPFWMYDAVRPTPDPSPICTWLDRKIYPADDPSFNFRWPPLHHGCQTGVRCLRAREAKRRGGVSPSDSPHAPQDGFGYSPAVSAEWRPDPGSRDDGFLGQLDRKIEEMLTKPDPLSDALLSPSSDVETKRKTVFGLALKSAVVVR